VRIKEAGVSDDWRKSKNPAAPGCEARGGRALVAPLTQAAPSLVLRSAHGAIARPRLKDRALKDIVKDRTESNEQNA
jgi:hypothetical protein